VLEPVLFDPELWVSYRVAEASVRDGVVEVFRFSDLIDEVPPLRRRMAGRRSGAV